MAQISGDPQILKKHVAAIHVGAPLSLLQRKLINALLFNAYDTLISARTHEIGAPLLCEMIGFESKNTAYLKAALRGLMETVIEFDVMEDNGTRSWEAMALLPYAKIHDGLCTYRFEQSLAEKLYHPDIYARINLSILRDMRSAHSLALYENCHRYLSVGQTAAWDLETFRKVMGVEGKYPAFKVLKRDVITPAMAEVNRVSNIALELVTARQGRQIATVQFMVTPNPLDTPSEPAADAGAVKSAANLALLEEGISKLLAGKWVAEHGEDYILEKLDLTRTQAGHGKINSSKTGFLRSAIEDGYHTPGTAQREAKQAVSDHRQHRLQLEGELQALKKQQKEIRLRYRGHCAALIEAAYQQLSDARKADVTSTFKRTLTSKIYVNAFQQYGWADQLSFDDIVKFWEARGLSFPSLPDWAQATALPSPTELDTRIDAVSAQLERAQ